MSLPKPCRRIWDVYIKLHSFLTSVIVECVISFALQLYLPRGKSNRKLLVYETGWASKTATVKMLLPGTEHRPSSQYIIPFLRYHGFEKDFCTEIFDFAIAIFLTNSRTTSVY